MTLRGDEYLRGYKAAMEYAALFARQAGAGTPGEKLMGLLAAHLEEKAESVARVVDIEKRMAEGLRRMGAKSLGDIGIELPPEQT